MKYKYFKTWGVALLIVVLSGPLSAKEEEVPTPLTLDYVLSLPATLNPAFMRQQGEYWQTLAQQAQTQAEDSWVLGARGRLGKREYANRTEDYHYAALYLAVPLFDFGRTEKANQAWLREVEANEFAMTHLQRQYKLLLMQAYFNVLLADLQYRVDNEAMAIAFVDLDKVRENHALARVSDAQLYESELIYQRAFVKRQRAQSDLRRSRMLLANAMGKPQLVISKLALPDLASWPDKLLPIERYLEQVLEGNAELLAAKQRVDAQQYRVESAQAGHYPVVKAEAWTGHLSNYPEIREGNWHAQLSMEFALYDGGLTKAKVDQARALRHQSLADQRALELALRDKVTNIYFELNLLRTEAEQVKVGQLSADLNLDYRRALYENEQQADLGDAMVRMSQAVYDALAFDLKQALYWNQMQTLLGVEDMQRFHQQAQTERGQD